MSVYDSCVLIMLCVLMIWGFIVVCVLMDLWDRIVIMVGKIGFL